MKLKSTGPANKLLIQKWHWLDILGNKLNIRVGILCGKHYIPQYYLRGFSKDGIFIYLYEKNVGIRAKY